VRGDAVVTTTELGGKRTLYDTKTLVDDGAAIKMVLQLVTPEDTITVVRWLAQCSGVGGGGGHDGLGVPPGDGSVGGPSEHGGPGSSCTGGGAGGSLSGDDDD